MSPVERWEFKSRMLEATQFQDAEKYSAYLRTSPGRLRSDLAWENLQGFLAAPAPNRRVLDYGMRVRVFDRVEVFQMLSQANLGVVAEYGVRVFSDYRDPADPDPETYRQIFELEFTLGALPQFAAIARYTQMIARHSSAARVSER
jgi:hypothetical protein